MATTMLGTAADTRTLSQAEIDAWTLRDLSSQTYMRETLATWLLAVLCAIVVLGFTALFVVNEGKVEDKMISALTSLLDKVLSPVITLLSTVIGFYFGAQAVKGSAGRGDSTAP
jgi:uncharacterized membrane protein